MKEFVENVQLPKLVNVILSTKKRLCNKMKYRTSIPPLVFDGLELIFTSVKLRTKGGLIDIRKFFTLAQISKNRCRPWALSIYREDAQGRDLAPIFGDLSQSEKLSEIKPPLIS